MLLSICGTHWYWVLLVLNSTGYLLYSVVLGTCVVVFATWYLWYSMVHGTYGVRRCWVVLKGVTTVHFLSTVDLEPHHDTVLCHVQGLQMLRTTPFS